MLAAFAVAAFIVAVPAIGASSASVHSTAPTASINVWMVDNGANVNNLWTQQATSFDAAHPGDHVNVSITPSSSNTYQVKLLSALGTNNPPALFFSWGGGTLQQFIQAGKAQPFADAGMTDAGSPSWTKDFLSSSLGPVTFNKKVYGIPILGTQPVLFFYNKTVLAKYHLAFPQTVPEMLSDVKILAAHNTALIGLGNVDNWEGLMYLEYFADREGGPSVFLNIQANKKNAWSNPAIVSALEGHPDARQGQRVPDWIRLDQLGNWLRRRPCVPRRCGNGVDGRLGPGNHALGQRHLRPLRSARNRCIPDSSGRQG